MHHFGSRLLFCLLSWSLNRWLSLILVVESLEALQRVKKSRPLVAKCETKDEPRTVKALPKCLQSHSEEQEGEVVPFHRVHPGDRLCCAIALYLTAAPSAGEQGLWPLKCLLTAPAEPTFAIPPQQLSF